MQPSTGPAPQKRKIAIAIDFGHSEPWHHDCYQGITNYAQRHGWRTVVDPMLMGITGPADIACYDGVVGRRRCGGVGGVPLNALAAV